MTIARRYATVSMIADPHTPEIDYSVPARHAYISNVEIVYHGPRRRRGAYDLSREALKALPNEWIPDGVRKEHAHLIPTELPSVLRALMLLEKSGPMTVRDIETKLRIGKNTAESAIRSLNERGKIVRVGMRGRFVLWTAAS